MSGLPIHGARIHRPQLRDDVLSRERLNGWLDQAATGRVALIVAEAGYGKTTLLADWSRHTRRRTIWYRLEPDDRDWLTFLRHLVGSGIEVEPSFAPETLRLLNDVGPGGPTQAQIVDSLLRELSDAAASDPFGFTLIFDDYHHIDGCDETDPIVRGIVERTGPGLSLVLATRTTPRLPLGRLRARGGLARLDGDALCFDHDETDRLFREAYRHPLDADVIADLLARTEGWAALLSLVRTSIEERAASDLRSYVGHLSGARGALHDYLAEEVVGRLPDRMQRFLMRVSILDAIDSRAIVALGDYAATEAAGLLRDAANLGILLASDSGDEFQVQPLVREFLESRLLAEVGADELKQMHLRLAQSLEDVDWRRSAGHYEKAGDQVSASRVIESSVEDILGTGAYRWAAEVLGKNPSATGARLILDSRVLLQQGNVIKSMDAARRAIIIEEHDQSGRLTAALLNAATIFSGARHYAEARDLAARAHSTASNDAQAELARNFVSLLDSSLDGDLVAISIDLDRLLHRQIDDGRPHYAAITHLNLAQVLVWLDRGEEAVRHASEALRLLDRTSRGYEMVSAHLARAHAQAHLGRWQAAEADIRHALEAIHPEARADAALDAGVICSWYGDPEQARAILASVHRSAVYEEWEPHWRVVELTIATDPQERSACAAALQGGPRYSLEVGAGFRWELALARTFLGLGDQAAFEDALGRTQTVASAQRSPVQARLCALLAAVGRAPEAASRAIRSWPASAAATLSVLAEEVLAIADALDTNAQDLVRECAQAQPQRWREPARRLIDAQPGSSAFAAKILEDIGELADVSRLRSHAKRHKSAGRPSAENLLRRLSPKVFVEDLGRVSVRIGDRAVSGVDIRRKVLALLCYLITRPGAAATRDQVLEAIWPDLDPDMATNSLNQTIYFLRRVIDPMYRAGWSAEYIHFESEVLWLDPELVDCRSWLCRRLLDSRPDTTATVDALVDNYTGRFAVDFAYDEWADAYRDRLHARYLDLVERTLTGAVGPLDPRWRLSVAQRAMTIDPQADEVEAAAIRLYRGAGAHAAAAEQYAHYAAYLRTELGLDPPPLEDL